MGGATCITQVAPLFSLNEPAVSPIIPTIAPWGGGSHAKEAPTKTIKSPFCDPDHFAARGL
jgi:hypothetical protein